MPDPVRFNDSMPLSDARATLRTLVDVGHQCPCCRQFSKVYRRRLNAGMAASLVKLWAAVGERPGVFAHGPSLRQALGTKFSYEELMAPASLLSQVAA